MLTFYSVAFQVIQVGFAFAFGACVGSLINVLVYRLPQGISVVTPPSRCPACSTKLRWNDNLPVIGWLLLKGRCRYCKVRISPEYPIVEAFVGLLFAGLYLLWYILPGQAVLLGINFGTIRPEWAVNGFAATWPAFVILLVLLSSLTAMTLVDAKTFTIPLVLTWVPIAVGLVGHSLHGLWVDLRGHGSLWNLAPGWDWTIPTPGSKGWWWIGAAIGGGIGVAISNLLLATGAIRRSFADYDEWERSAKAELEAKSPAAASGEKPAQAQHGESEPPADMWIQYPHARREMAKELVFLAPILALMMVGGAVARKIGGPVAAGYEHAAPLWLNVAAGALMGYLIGAGIVWAFRVFGSIAFGKEAIGLGDVHLMGAVGACMGWIDVILAFFGAAFVGIVFAVLRSILKSKVLRTLPYGPSLAIATLLVVLFKPLIEQGLTALLRADPPVNIP